MTCWRDTSMLDFSDHAMPITPAESMMPHHTKKIVGEVDSWLTWLAIEHRAIWESGYESGFHNARYGSQVFDTLRSNEQQIADLQERVRELTAERGNLRLCLDEIYTLTQSPDDDYETIFLNIESLANSKEPGYMDVEAYRGIELENERLTAELKQARTALRPFARMAEVYHDLSDGTDIDGEWMGEGIAREYRRIMVSDFRQAALTIKETNEQ